MRGADVRREPYAVLVLSAGAERCLPHAKRELTA
jgi:hypothetical protein